MRIAMNGNKTLVTRWIIGIRRRGALGDFQSIEIKSSDTGECIMERIREIHRQDKASRSTFHRLRSVLLLQKVSLAVASLPSVRCARRAKHPELSLSQVFTSGFEHQTPTFPGLGA